MLGTSGIGRSSFAQYLAHNSFRTIFSHLNDIASASWTTEPIKHSTEDGRWVIKRGIMKFVLGAPEIDMVWRHGTLPLLSYAKCVDQGYFYTFGKEWWILPVLWPHRPPDVLWPSNVVCTISSRWFKKVHCWCNSRYGDAPRSAPVCLVGVRLDECPKNREIPTERAQRVRFTPM